MYKYLSYHFTHYQQFLQNYPERQMYTGLAENQSKWNKAR